MEGAPPVNVGYFRSRPPFRFCTAFYPCFRRNGRTGLCGRSAPPGEVATSAIGRPSNRPFGFPGRRPFVWQVGGRLVGLRGGRRLIPGRFAGASQAASTRRGRTPFPGRGRLVPYMGWRGGLRPHPQTWPSTNDVSLPQATSREGCGRAASRARAGRGATRALRTARRCCPIRRYVITFVIFTLSRRSPFSVFLEPPEAHRELYPRRRYRYALACWPRWDGPRAGGGAPRRRCSDVPLQAGVTASAPRPHPCPSSWAGRVLPWAVLGVGVARSSKPPDETKRYALVHGALTGRSWLGSGRRSHPAQRAPGRKHARSGRAAATLLGMATRTSSAVAVYLRTAA